MYMLPAVFSITVAEAFILHRFCNAGIFLDLITGSNKHL